MTSIKYITILSLLLIASACLGAWSITDSYFGNKLGSQDARSYAMGGTGLFDDLRPFGISNNPANLTLMNKKVGISGSGFLNRNEDNRSVPLYNSFDNYVDDAVYASNANFFTNYAVAGFSALVLPKCKFGFGAYYKPLLSFDGKYDEQIRNNRNTDNDGYPEKVAENAILNEGALNQLGGALSVGMNFGESMDLNLGFDYSMLNGTTDSSKTIRWSQWAIDTVGEGVLPDYTWTESTKLEGSRIKAGATFRINELFGVGATWTNKAILKRTGTTTTQRDAYLNHNAIDESIAIDEDYILPAEYRVGMNYQPRNIMRTWFNIEAEYVQFSDVGTQYDDAFNLYAGVEHAVKNYLPLRLGFQATTGYLRLVESDGAILAKKILTPMITAGSSIPILDNLHLDLGFGYSWREYEATDLFGDAYYNDKLYTGQSTYQLWPNQYIVLADRGWENPDKVRESNISLNSCLSFTW
jgi:hypothetical protein